MSGEIENAIKASQGECLKAIRKRYHRTTTKFADDIGIDRATLYLYETGRRVISTKALYAIWDKYKVSPSMVLGIEKLRFV